MNILLQRATIAENGTFGILSMNGTPLCLTLEDPWNDNQKNISCIPEGIYDCAPHSGLKYHDVWHVKNVPDRSAILIHAGNTIRDTEGCILVGLKLGWLEMQPAILESKSALSYLRENLPEEFQLEIRNPCSK